MSRRYSTVAVGGTFDHFHKGHEVLISNCFEIGERVVIGITSDSFAAKLSKRTDQPYDERILALESFISVRFPKRKFEIHKLEDYFGPAVIEEDVQAIVVTKETAERAKIANKERIKRGLKPLEAVIIDFVVAQDGKPISSTRIIRGEISREGKVLKRI
ncbi:MAG: phosphopantetheine adenylyltransferase [Thaumarchaeota archaeon]|nr:phosphopantetheine adenylyltransferase [Nitrososphaerota archaeon]